MKKIVSAALIGVMVAGCASGSGDIAPAYVSPLQYTSYSCPQLREEATRISSRAAQAIGAQDQKASNDAAATGVALVLFWPALFFIKGDGASAAEVSRLKGEMEAIESASVRKRCGIEFRRAPAQA